jgi:hypothetical protein
MKEDNPFSLNNKTKHELIKYIIKIEKTVNKAIKKLDTVSDPAVRAAIKILKGEIK